MKYFAWCAFLWDFRRFYPLVLPLAFVLADNEFRNDLTRYPTAEPLFKFVHLAV